MLEPSNTWFASPSKSNILKFYISDDWAGVDTWTIIIEISQIESWSDVILTGYIYSWSDLDIQLSWWSEWLWNEWSYVVSLYPKEDFPINTQIDVFVTWADLAGNYIGKVFTFSTRPDCSFYGCRNMTKIIWPNGIWEWMFTGNVLIITWTNPNSSIYPYLSGDTLYCGNENWTGLLLTWNISLYSGDDSIWNSIWYDRDSLNVTGDSKLNINYQDGKIIVIKQD
jgi:hypothetical protein